MPGKQDLGNIIDSAMADEILSLDASAVVLTPGGNFVSIAKIRALLKALWVTAVMQGEDEEGFHDPLHSSFAALTTNLRLHLLPFP